MEDKAVASGKIVDLPNYPNAFIGRTHHIQFVSVLLKEEGKQLITLLGPGGMGKTRLSVRIGRQLVDHFGDGVCFVPLESVTDYEQVPLYIGHRLGLKARFAGDWVETVIDYLSDKHFLLILDNLEQILPFSREIDRILAACPRLKILVTSREILGLIREIEYPLDSLNRPNPRLFPSPEDLIKFDAIDLFVQKAKTSRPDFELNNDNAVAIVRICQELDGLPLPIELAAAQIKLFSPKLIFEKLTSRFDLLKNRSAGVVARHQNIRNTVQWSYDLLEEEERQLFRQLALFRGGFTPESLEAICPGYDALESIESFINKSLIVKGEEVGEWPRFRMLKLIRDYGMERLQEQPDREDQYHRFADYYLSFLERGERHRRTTESGSWLALVEAEYENLETALDWLSRRRPEQAVQLGTLFWRFHLARGFLREGLKMIVKLLSFPIAEQHLKAKLLEGAGTLSHNLGDHLKAKDYFGQCLELWETIGDEMEIVKALNNLAWAAWRTGDFDQTLVRSEKALEISDRLNDASGRAKSLNNIAWIHFYRGGYDRAEVLQRRVLSMHMLINDPGGIAFARTNLAWVLIRNGKLLEAREMINRAIEAFLDLKNLQLLAFARSVLAEFHFETGDLSEAEVLIREYCLPGFERIGDIWGIAQCHHWLGRMARKDNRSEEAGFHFTRSIEYFRNTHDKFGLASTECRWSRFCREQGDTGTAAAALDESLLLAAEMKVNDLLAFGHFEQAYQLLGEQSYDRAIQHLAVADYHAEILGIYRYEQFKTETGKVLQAVRQALASGKADLVNIFSDKHWHIPERHLAGIPGKNELRERLRGMLRVEAINASIEGPPRKDQPDQMNREDSTAAELHPFVVRAQRIIESHLADPSFSVKDLCREMNLSHSQMHRRLSEHTGHSSSQFIRHLRIERAKTLLADPQLTIAAVAYDSGFRDADYFYRVFKQVVGITPGAFRGN